MSEEKQTQIENNMETVVKTTEEDSERPLFVRECGCASLKREK